VFDADDVGKTLAGDMLALETKDAIEAAEDGGQRFEA